MSRRATYMRPRINSAAFAEAKAQRKATFPAFKKRKAPARDGGLVTISTRKAKKRSCKNIVEVAALHNM
jgi:hypothetical protein